MKKRRALPANRAIGTATRRLPPANGRQRPRPAQQFDARDSRGGASNASRVALTAGQKAGWSSSRDDSCGFSSSVTRIAARSWRQRRRTNTLRVHRQ